MSYPFVCVFVPIQLETTMHVRAVQARIVGISKQIISLEVLSTVVRVAYQHSLT